MDGIQSELLARMPLAESVLILWRFIADDERLQGVFERHRGRCYEREISFPVFVRLIADALLEYEGSGNQSFQRAREGGVLEATTRAAYEKLSRVPIGLSVGLFSELTDRLRDLFPEDALRQLPRTLQGFDVVCIDGKTMKRVAKRLKPLRSVGGGVSGGKAVVATEYLTGLALGMVADPDGNANDVRLLPDLLPYLRDRLERPRLWVADRQYCDLVQIGRFSEEEDAFLLRYNAKVSFHSDPDHPLYQGDDGQGRSYSDECGWLGRDGHAQQTYVRRITLHRETGDDIVIVTNLFGRRKHKATDLLNIYLERWGIERMFQQVTEVFGLEKLIGGTPEATVFQFAFCLLLYNQTQLVRAFIAKHQQLECEQISLENLYLDVRRQLIAWSVVMGVHAADVDIPAVTAKQVSRRLDKLLRKQWTNRWKKACNRQRRNHPQKPKSKTHTTVHKVLQETQHR